MGHASTLSRIAKEEASHASALRKLERAVDREAPREEMQKDPVKNSKFKDWNPKPGFGTSVQNTGLRRPPRRGGIGVK